MGTYPTIGVPLGVPLRLLLVVALWSLQAVAVRASEPIVNVGDSQQTSQFESHIRPIFREYCFDCHGATEELSSGMDLRLVRFLIAGGDSGPAIVPGDAQASYLLELVSSGEMPPGEVHLPAEKVQLIEQWITAGAPTLRPEPETIGPGVPLSVEDRRYWVYQPIVAALPPIDPSPIDPSPQSGDRSAVARTPIDQWIEAAMPEGLTFAPEAKRSTLIKRAYYNLTGLPPTADEQRHWLEHTSSAWFDEMLEKLLASPAYGERWARHWLDVAGYADSAGYTSSDELRPWAWKYRDYVIRSLCADKPLDRFITEQLAGDELAGPKRGDWTAEQIELLTATGFLRMAADGTGSGDNSPEARNKVIADSMKIIGTTLLGSSLHCAQCHDHRYDPISLVDYTAIRSVFEPAWDWQQWRVPTERLISLSTEAERQQAAQVEMQVQEIAKRRQAEQDKYMAEALEQELMKHEEALREPLRAAYNAPAAERTAEQQALLKTYPSVNISPGVLYQYLPAAAEELKKFDTQIAELRSTKPIEEFISALTEPEGHAPLARLFFRGDYQQPREEIAPAGLSVLAAEGERAEFSTDDASLPSTGRRLAFARWLTDGSNPLVARVLVNRVWMHHFGQGIVATPGEFGRLGSLPTHPELLDWLAADLMEHGWSLKHLHRQIVRSTVWRQSSQATDAQRVLDPDNRYYSRRALQRMDAEIIRDTVLAAVGRLDASLFGPPLAIKEDDAGQVIVDGSQSRRSLYILARRTQPVAMLQAFDAPVMDINCEYRPTSTVATQSLIMLNGEFCLEQAAHMAELIAGTLPVPPAADPQTPEVNATEADASEADAAALLPAVRRAWELALCRAPQPEELVAAKRFISEQLSALRREPRGVAEGRTAEQQVLVNLCHTLLNTNEFLVID
jgi:hypothetical protein